MTIYQNVSCFQKTLLAQFKNCEVDLKNMNENKKKNILTPLRSRKCWYILTYIDLYPPPLPLPLMDNITCVNSMLKITIYRGP